MVRVPGCNLRDKLRGAGGALEGVGIIDRRAPGARRGESRVGLPGKKGLITPPPPDSCHRMTRSDRDPLLNLEGVQLRPGKDSRQPRRVKNWGGQGPLTTSQTSPYTFPG